MKHYMKSTFLFLVTLSSFVGIFFLIIQELNTLPPHTFKIVASVEDLSQQPISGAAFMLYRDGEDECLHARISNIRGRFQMPRPTPGLYYFSTIIDKQLLVSRRFRVLPHTALLDFQFSYSGSSISSSHENTFAKNKPKNELEISKMKKNIATLKEFGTITGEVFLDNNNIKKSIKIEFSGKHQETGEQVYYEIVTDDGKYEIPKIAPGPYSLDVKTSGYDIVKNLETFILANKKNNLDIYFKKKVSQQNNTNISVTVIDASWSPQAGANVTMTSLDGGYVQNSNTDQNGEAVFKGVPAGEYRIKATFNGVRGQCSLEENLNVVAKKFVSIVLRETD